MGIRAYADSSHRIEGDAERSSDTPAPKLDVILVQAIKVDGNFSSRIVASLWKPRVSVRVCMFVFACVPVWESAASPWRRVRAPYIQILYR